MTEILTELIIILLLILANGIFSMSEMALITSRKARLQSLADKGKKGARVALFITEDPSRFLSSIQVGITLIGVFTGALSGVTITGYLTSIFTEHLGPYAHYATSLAFLVVVMLVTYFSLILGELLPKQIALTHREAIAVFMARPMLFFTSLIKPMAWFLSISTAGLLRILHIKKSSEPTITEDEIRILINEGTKAGIFEKSEQSMVDNVFNLDDLPVSQLMTHRPDVVWLNVNDTIENNFKKIFDSGHSYFPVCGDGLDDVLGITSVKYLLPGLMKGDLGNLKNHLSEPLYIPENTAGSRLLETFKQTRKYIALIIDEYGSVQGIASLKDVLEAIVGDLPSIENPEDVDAVQREDGSWLIDGMMSIEDFEEMFHIDLTPENEGASFNTIAGFIMNRLEKLPVTGEQVFYEDFTFEIVDMDGRRIDKILVVPPLDEEGEAAVD